MLGLTLETKIPHHIFVQSVFLVIHYLKLALLQFSFLCWYLMAESQNALNITTQKNCHI